MKYPLRIFSLFAFFSAVKLDYINIHLPLQIQAEDANACSVQAWVRAPDLSPGEIISGQVKVRAKGPCDPITEYSLILRFKERVWVESRKPADNASIFEVGSVMNKLQGLPFEKYRLQEFMNFTVQSSEEERIAFESKYKLFEGHRSDHHSIHDFAILVPTTNYPPSENSVFWKYLYNELSKNYKRYNEHTSLYTVEIKFVNGTIIEVPAGYTSFSNIDLTPRSNTSEIVTLPARFTSYSTELSSPSDFSNLTFHLNVTFPHGRDLEQGSTHDLIFTWTPSDWNQDNYDITLQQLQITDQARRTDTILPKPEENTTALTTFAYTYDQIIPTNPDNSHLDFSKLRQEQSNPKLKWNTTTSVALHVSETIFPSIDMYYQSHEANLNVMLLLQSNAMDFDTAPEEEEDYEWTPHKIYPKHAQMFHFHVPVTIHPSRTRTKLGESDAVINMTHYLSPDARQPLFVDPSTSSVARLMQLTVEERDLLAPKCSPVITRMNGGQNEVLQERYHQGRLYYVGDTWLRKVLLKDCSRSSEAASDPETIKEGDAQALLVQAGQ